MTAHENHERYHTEECGECMAEFDRQMIYYGALYRAEAPHRESIALARMDIDSDKTGELDADELQTIYRRLK